MTDPRSTSLYKRLRRRFLDDHRDTTGVCDKCHHPMDYSGKGRPHRRTATIEHTVAVEHRPDLCNDVSLWRAWCLSCNSAGNRNKSTPPVAQRAPERRW